MKYNLMRISDLKLGQKINIKGVIAKYKGIQKVRISNFGKAEKRVFQVAGSNTFIYYTIVDGSKMLKSEKIKLI
ncbi:MULTISPECIES: hypothetical protein [Chryseobacterium]|uniref:Uncharacterized protein n=2 Tax=Chryseobacterium TaxID=59732 RepID=A0A4U8WGT0_9FLAO|nr:MULTISPECIES: hypothetical protein [Chryseobacterium]QQV01812.1 hypothetical protein I6I61_12025 [Chryseobacterium sp. FDAARGOS 1104]VFB04976.1 Uncharacterised protein [Chryseobacterium taihuense]